MTNLFGRDLGTTVLGRTFVLAEVLFGPLDAGEDLSEERLVLGLLAVLQSRRQLRQSHRAGQAAAGAGTRKLSARRLDGFVAELVCGLLAPPQQLLVLHLDETQILGTCVDWNCITAQAGPSLNLEIT